MKRFFYFIMVGFILSGCSSIARTESEPVHADTGVRKSVVMSKAADYVIETSNAESSAKSDRMVAYSAYVKLGVEDAEVASKSIASKVADIGGYVEEESRTSMVVFIPAKDLDSFMEYLDGDVGYIKDKSKSGKDVTEPHGDTVADLAAAKAARERYTVLLKKANKVDEVLSIEKELERVNAKILKLEQQLARTTKSVEMSRVSITLDDSVLIERLAPPILTLSLIGGLLLFLL